MQRRTHTAQPACEISEESALEEPQMNDTLLLTFLVVFRVANALVCATSFVPDEYWQALEVAHKAVFGYPLYKVAIVYLCPVYVHNAKRNNNLNIIMWCSYTVAIPCTFTVVTLSVP